MSKQQSGKQAETNDQKDGELDDMELEELYNWVDKIPLSKPKKNISRDFSDGMLVGEVIDFYIPKLVQFHNYTPTMNTKRKMQNWFTMNRKVFKKLGFELSENVINDLVQGKPMTIEKVLLMLQTKLNTYQHEKERRESSKPEADQDYQVSPGRRSDTKGARSIIDGKQKSRTKHPDIKTSDEKQQEFEYVPRAMYDERVHYSKAKEEVILLLQARIREMESLVQVKDATIIRMENEVHRRNHYEHGPAALEYR